MTGPYPSLREDTIKDVGIKFHGVSQREKHHYAIRAIRRTKMQVPKPCVLVQRILCRLGGKNKSRIAEYIKNHLKEDEMEEQLRIPSASPFTGSRCS